jgi:hypothetical protein
LPTQMATQWKKILRISELYQKKNQLYPYAKAFFLSCIYK